MRMDLNCPAEILTVEMPTEDDPRAKLVLMNLADRGVNSCEATVRLRDRDGREIARTVHRARALTGRPRSTFSMTVPMEPVEGAARAEARLDKVWFEDNDVWRRNKSEETEYEANNLPAGNDLNALRYVAGKEAVGFPSQQADVWVCVCGRPNDNRSVICARCRRQKDMIFQQYNRNAVLRAVSQRERQLDLQTRGAREESNRIQHEREAEYNITQERKARRRRLLIALIAGLFCAALAVFAVRPALKLLSADKALEEDRLEDAKETLETIEGFPGAAQRMEETTLRIAREDAGDATAQTVERLSEVSETLRTENAEAADIALADTADLTRAEKLLASGDIDGAEALAETLPEDLEGRASLLADCAYARAEKAMDERDYDTARGIFLDLGSWRDSATKAVECLYEPALTMIENGEYDAAIATLETISDYADSAEQIQKCYYLKAESLEASGDVDGAREAYVGAGDYSDAKDKIMEIDWNRAEALREEGDLAGALEIYKQLGDYAEAKARWQECALELSRKYYKQREYALAVETLEDIPEVTKEVTQIRTRGTYLGAKAAANRGELETAIEMIERVPDYSDAGKLAKSWRVLLAQTYFDEGKYEEAKAVLESIADDNSAKKLLKKIEDALATPTPAPEETIAPAEGSGND